MIRDITIGQYFNGNSFVHRLDSRMKIILMTIYIIMVFSINNLQGLIIPIVFIAVCYFVSKIPIKMILRSIKPMIPIIAFTGIINMFFISGDVLYSFWIFNITRQGIIFSIFMVIRIITLVIGTSLLTYTTSPIELTDAIERLFKPLNKIKVPVHELAMMMTIALRFIPTLIEETDKIMSAQKARGADLESGNIIDKVKAMIPILIPLFISSFRRADELALAMDCRCYRGGEGRTRMKQMKITKNDFIALFIVICCLTLAIYLNFIYTAVF
ncbi:MAG: energy-coupling factor transporter transmembrane component T family protein [Oscillospiraceae bacterium]